VTFSTIPTPSPGSSECAPYYQNDLTAVAEVSANDVWAVGFYCGSGNTQPTLTEHWDGSQWTQVASPNPSSYSALYGVVAFATDNVWAVGQDYGTPLPSTLIEHWNGNGWSIVGSPNPPGRTAYLAAVAGSSPTDIWAVGYSGSAAGTIPLVEHYDGRDKNGQTGLTEHWDGTEWRLVSGPVAGPAETQFYAVAANSSHDVWAFGSTWNNSFDMVPLIEHWTGGAWQIVTSPDPGKAGEFFGATSIQGHLWGVGDCGLQAGGYVSDPLTLVIKR